MKHIGGGPQGKMKYHHKPEGFCVVCVMCGAESPPRQDKLAAIDAAEDEGWRMKGRGQFCPEHLHEDIMKFLGVQ